MAAGLEIEVEGRAARPCARMLECVDFGMIAAGKMMITGADDFIAADQDRADHRIGTRSAGGFLREPAGKPHVTALGIGPRPFRQLGQSLLVRGAAARSAVLFRSLMRSSSSTMNSLMSLNERYTDAKRTYATGSVSCSSRIAASPITELGISFSPRS